MKSVHLAVFCVFLASCAPLADQRPELGTPQSIAVWPVPPATARIRFSYAFGGPRDLGLRGSFSNFVKGFFAGSSKPRMVRPYALAIDGGQLAVTDPGLSVVHLFDFQTKRYSQISSLGKYNLSSPVGVAFSKDRMYIADSVLQRVFVLDGARRLLVALEGFGRPTGLVFDQRSQRIYVTDTLAHCVKMYDRDGNFVGFFGHRGEAPGEFNYPSHLALAGDRVYVNDTLNFRVQVFDLEGRYVNSFGDHGDSQGYFAHPKGIAALPNGLVMVAEAVANRIQIFNNKGEFLLGFGTTGSQPGEFDMPTGIAIDKDTIYIADSRNHRVQVFEYLGDN